MSGISIPNSLQPSLLHLQLMTTKPRGYSTAFKLRIFWRLRHYFFNRSAGITRMTFRSSKTAMISIRAFILLKLLNSVGVDVPV